MQLNRWLTGACSDSSAIFCGIKKQAIDVHIMKLTSMLIFSRYYDFLMLPIGYRSGYVTPWWLDHTPFITTTKAIKFAWWSFWSRFEDLEVWSGWHGADPITRNTSMANRWLGISMCIANAHLLLEQMCIVNDPPLTSKPYIL